MENLIYFSRPYPAYIADGFLESNFLNRLVTESKPLKKFHEYNDNNSKKITSVPYGIEGIMVNALNAIAQGVMPLIDGVSDARPDMSFYGAGLSIMRKGDFLKPHVDHAFHPKTKHARMFNALLYITDCDGGYLRLIGKDIEIKVKPKKNRLVFFQSYGDAVHAVEPVENGERIALSVYFYSPTFIPVRSNEKADFL